MSQERMSAAEARAQLAPAAKPSKYRNTPVTVDGIRFDSKREAAYYSELKIREKAGEVGGVEDGPMVGSLELTGTTYEASEESASTTSSKKKITIKVTSVNKRFTIQIRKYSAPEP